MILVCCWPTNDDSAKDATKAVDAAPNTSDGASKVDRAATTPTSSEKTNKYNKKTEDDIATVRNLSTTTSLSIPQHTEIATASSLQGQSPVRASPGLQQPHQLALEIDGASWRICCS
jgi:hypothetical protein